MKKRNIRLYPSILVGLFAAFIGLIIPWFSKYFIDEILINQNIQYTVPFLLFWFFFEATRFTGFGLRAVYTTNAAGSITVDAGIFILEKIHKCSKLIFKKYSPANFIIHINEVESNGNTLIDIVNEISEIVIYLFALPLAFLIIDPWLALIIGTTVILCVTTSVFLSRAIDKLHLKRRSEEALYVQRLLSTMEHTEQIRSYGIKNEIFSEIHSQNHLIKEVGLRKAGVTQASRTANRFIFSLGSFFYRLVSVYLIYDSKMTIGDFFAFNAILSLLFSPIELLTSLVRPAQEMLVNSRRMEELFQYPEQYNGRQKMPDNGRLKLESVSFVYEANGHHIVDDFDFEFENGVLYGLVGHNGAGKSTLLQLIARYYDPIGGRISYNLVPINEIERDEYHSSVIYIPTSGYVFPTAFEKNIILNKQFESVKFEKISGDFDISPLKEKFANVNGSFFAGKEMSLSSGENQKICLARAIYHGYKIFLFDEAFSYLDAVSQANVISIIRKHLNNYIVIIASHDINTIRHLDYILCLENGKLVEEGDFQSLFKREAVFTNLFSEAVN